MFYLEENGKRKKVKAKDLQENIAKLRESMEWVEEEREKLIEKLKETSFENDEEKYSKLTAHLKNLNEMYNSLQEQEEKQYTILKKYKESKFFISPKDWLTIGGTTLLGVITIGLDRESPAIVKKMSFITRLIPLH